MKYLVLAIIGLTAMAGCVDKHASIVEPDNIGYPSPEVFYCFDRGGKVEIAQSATGEDASCHLPNGTTVEVGEFFRANHKG